MDFLKKIKKIKNLLTKPNNGGIPANDISKITIYTDIDFRLPIYLKSPKVFKYLKSNRKKILNIFNNKKTYKIIFNRSTE